ncbi:hypothetical protein [Streptomyces sp. NPDC010273]|uniref:hypothetical protein n=1 Tax=Streptomyces sp. NPDC010273 TaxID=3364829 RepID=UPI0036E4DA1D
MVTARQPLVLAHTSREYVHVPVSGSPDLDIRPELAFLTTPNNPEDDDWHQAEWHEGAARTRIGPNGDVTDLAPGRYRIWIRFTAGPERPVINAGLLHLT